MALPGLLLLLLLLVAVEVLGLPPAICSSQPPTSGTPRLGLWRSAARLLLLLLPAGGSAPRRRIPASLPEADAGNASRLLPLGFAPGRWGLCCWVSCVLSAAVREEWLRGKPAGAPQRAHGWWPQQETRGMMPVCNELWARRVVWVEGGPEAAVVPQASGAVASGPIGVWKGGGLASGAKVLGHN